MALWGWGRKARSEWGRGPGFVGALVGFLLPMFRRLGLSTVG